MTAHTLKHQHYPAHNKRSIAWPNPDPQATQRGPLGAPDCCWIRTCRSKCSAKTQRPCSCPTRRFAHVNYKNNHCPAPHVIASVAAQIATCSALEIVAAGDSCRRRIVAGEVVFHRVLLWSGICLHICRFGLSTNDIPPKSAAVMLNVAERTCCCRLPPYSVKRQ